ncbi:MAG: aspartate/glutamate racemase family protein [Pseudomonadota bacterium]
MRILCLNANTTPYVTTTVGDEMRATLGEAAEVLDRAAAFGPAVIMTRLDNAVAVHGVVDAAAAAMEAHPDIDAIMLAVSFDTARDALREALSIPVVGMTEASVAMARLVGGRIGYISMGAAVTPLYRETLGHCDLDRDMAGWEALEAPSAYRPGDKTELDALLTNAAASLGAQGADVVVLLGAVLAGAARRLADKSPVPLIDGGAAGALMARAMVDLGAPTPKVGTYARRPGGRLGGVSEALARLQAPD